MNYLRELNEIKGLPIWGCPIKDAYMQKREEKENEIHRPYQKYVR